MAAKKELLNRTGLLFFLLVFSHSVCPNTLSLSASTDIATAGYFQLTWRGPHKDSSFVVQESDNAQFSTPKTLYQGSNTASVISGRHDGTYFYRVGFVDKASTTQWSEAISVNVRHHALGKAFGIFAIGFVVFVITLFTIFTGTRRQDS